MAPTLGADRNYGKSRSRGQGPAAVQAAFNCQSLDSAQKKISRAFAEAERVAQVLLMQGAAAPVVTHRARIDELLETGPAPEYTDAFRIAGRKDRAEDEAVVDCLIDGATDEELALVEIRTEAEIAAKHVQLRSVRAERARRRAAQAGAA